MAKGIFRTAFFGLATSLLALAVVSPSRASESATITKSEVRAGDPKTTHRRLRDVVWDMFEAQDYRREQRPTRPLEQLLLQTKIQATGVPGLCRYDQVWIEFEPVSQEGHGADTPVRAKGLTSRSYFAFMSPPRADYEEIYEYGPTSAKECANVAKAQSFFTAKDDYQATNGYRAWLELLDTVRSKKNLLLDCELLPHEAADCRQVIAGLRAEQLESVEACDPQENPATFCYRLTAGQRQIDVFVGGRSSAGPPPGEVVRANLHSLIVIRDQAID